MRRLLLSTLPLLPLLALAPSGHAEEPAGEKSFWTRDTLSGDWGGLRTTLQEHGISFEINETDEVLGNPSGGMHQGAVFDGKTQVQMTLDLEKLVQWPGAKIVSSFYQVHGRGLSADNIGNLLTVSNIEAPLGTRLGDLYIEQSLFDDMVNVRVGQFAADEEFMSSDVAGVFINSTFGWPGIYGTDLPGGGPAYPYSTPGVRVRVAPTPAFSVQGAVFNGNPLGKNGDWGGTEFPLDGVFAILEATYTTMPGKDDPGLGGNFKLGAWYNSLHFADLHMDDTGLSLANPASSGVPASHSGNYGLYASVDHQILRTQGTADGGLAGFLRLAAAPQQDRNPVYVYVDAGLTWKGTFPDRDDDVVGIAVAWANLSHSLRSLDRDTIAFTGVSQPIRSSEMVLEVTYQAAVTPWLVVQPDFQYVIRPGGDIPNPVDPSTTLGNAVVLGLRTSIKF